MNDRGYHVSYTTVASIIHENDWFSIRTSAKTFENICCCFNTVRQSVYS